MLDKRWQIPEPYSVGEVRPNRATSIFLRRHGNPAGPRLVLCHGTGLAIDLYFPFWSLLTDDFDLILYDLRSHGWNPVGPLEEHNVMAFARDHEFVLEAVDRLFGEKPKATVFHSISALAWLLSAHDGYNQPSQTSANILFDPPIGHKVDPTDPEVYDVAFKLTAAMLRKRPQQFESIADFRENFPFGKEFRRTVPGLVDLAAETLLRNSGEGYVLRCPPAYDAQVLEYACILSRMVDFQALRAPTKIIGADPTIPYSFLPTFDLAEIMTVDYDFIPDTTHFAQLEKPAECVAAMREFLERNGFMSS